MIAFFFMKKYIILIVFFSSLASPAQDNLLVNKSYLEDQLYIGINYNILQNKPELVQQKGISINYQLGFIKDLPLNKKGNVALGIGLGYAYNKYNQTILIDKNQPEFSLVVDDYNKNKFETHCVELPFEIRIRNSSPTQYKFWRIYFGGKIAYVFSSKSVFEDLDALVIKNRPIPYLKKWQYGPQLSFGYGTWNIYTFFNVNPLFDKAPIVNAFDVNTLKSFKIGLQFYIF